MAKITFTEDEINQIIKDKHIDWESVIEILILLNADDELIKNIKKKYKSEDCENEKES